MHKQLYTNVNEKKGDRMWKENALWFKMVQLINEKGCINFVYGYILYTGYIVERINNTVILCKFATDVFVKDKKMLSTYS